MEVLIFLNFHPPGNDLVFGPNCPLPRAILKKYPCSNKIWKMTMLQKNLRSDHTPNNVRSDHAPSKNKYDRFPPKCDKWNMVICQIMVEPFSLVLKIGDKWKYSFSWIFTHPVMTWFLGPLIRNQELCSKNTHVPTEFEEWPCSWKFEKRPCSNKIWEATMLQ